MRRMKIFLIRRVHRMLKCSLFPEKVVLRTSVT